MEHRYYTKSIASEIRKELKRAKHSIVVSVPWFTDPSIYGVIKDKAKVGVDIKILVQDDEINRNADFDIKELATYNATIYYNSSKFRLSHRKFCVIDSKVVIKGSYNWTKKARSNEEEIDIFYSNELALKQLVTFEESVEKRDVKRYNKQELLEIERKERLRVKYICKFTPYKENGKFGFKNEYGEVVIPSVYDAVTEFKPNWYEQKSNYENLFLTQKESERRVKTAYVFAKKNNKWGLIDNYNNEVTLDGFNECFVFSVISLAFSYSFKPFGYGSYAIKYYFIKCRDRVGLIWFDDLGYPRFLFNIEYSTINVRNNLQNGHCFIIHRRVGCHGYKISYLVVKNNHIKPTVYHTNQEFESVESVKVPVGYQGSTFFKVSIRNRLNDLSNKECYGLLKIDSDKDSLGNMKFHFCYPIKPLFFSLKQMIYKGKHFEQTVFEVIEHSNKLKTITLNLSGEVLHNYQSKESLGNRELLTQDEINRREKDAQNEVNSKFAIAFWIIIIMVFMYFLIS